LITIFDYLVSFYNDIYPPFIGSQSNFITEGMAQSIRAKRTSINMPVFGIIHKTSLIRHKITAQIQSRVSEYSKRLEFLILPKITGNIPFAPLDTKAWTIPTDKALADPHFNTPQQIDMLIGAEIFFDVWTNQQFQLQKEAPMLQGSVFGWIIAGKCPPHKE
jgi:hypothetical protein